MTIEQLRRYLKDYSQEMIVKIRLNSDDPKSRIVTFNIENILETSENAFIDSTFPEDEWDHEDGKIVQSGNPYLLINPIIY